MVDLNHVALFVQVVRAGSFAEAARRLGMPANTASRRVQQLERQLGVRLMQRSTRRLTLTDAGNTFFAQCADEVEALGQSAQQLAEGGEVPSGRVRVAAPADFFNWFAIGAMAEFLAAHPRIKLEFVLNDARADLLGEGIDIALRAGRDLEPHLIARQIGVGRSSLVASPAYLAAHGEPDSPQALAQHDCLLVPGRPLWQLDGPDGEVEIEVHGRFAANASQALLEAAVAGLGIGLLPTVISAAQVEAGRLKTVLAGHGIAGVGIYFVYLSRRQLPRAVSAFMEFAAARMCAQGLIEPASAHDRHGERGER